MAVYFDHKIESPPGAGTAINIAWHSNQAILAVASRNERSSGDVEGAVNLYLDEGEHVDGSSLQRAHPVTSLAWHPKRRTLVAGWENGEITAWNDNDRQLDEIVAVHRRAVLRLDWHPNGHRLVSLDEDGMCCVWRVDSKGQLRSVPMQQYVGKGALTHCVVRAIKAQDSAPVSELTKKVAPGDEAAFSFGSRAKAAAKLPLLKGRTEISDSMSFFYGGASGVVYMANDEGDCTEVLRVSDPIKALLLRNEKDILVVLTDTMMLSQHAISPDGSLSLISEIKLGGRSFASDVAWTSRGCLVTSANENILRMWDLETEDIYALTVTGLPGIETQEVVQCVSYNSSKGILAAGTNMGHVVMWQHKGSSFESGKTGDGASNWEALAPSQVEGSVLQIRCGGVKNLVAINSTLGVQILSENVMNSHFRNQVSAIQVAPSQLLIECLTTGVVHNLKTDIHVKGIYVTKDHTTVWNGKKIVVYEVPQDKPMIRTAGAFSCESMSIVVNEQTLYSIEGDKIQIRNFQGIIKQSLQFVEMEGAPVALNVAAAKSLLAVGTTNGIIKMWDIAKREARPHYTPKNMREYVPNFVGLVALRCNAAGNRIAFLANQIENLKSLPSTKVFVWDIEADVVLSFDFLTGSCDDSAGGGGGGGGGAGGQSIAGPLDPICNQYPISLHWDENDARLLVCETLPTERRGRSRTRLSNEADKKQKMVDLANVVSLFATAEHGILVQDSFPLDSSKHTALLAIDAPYFYFCKKPAQETDPSTPVDGLAPDDAPTQRRMISKRTMRDFVGLEDSDASARTAMMDFSYFMTIGNMDEAFKAIKLIKSETVWENMARMCVKSKQLDVAFVCLGNMGHARGARALREAMKEPELDARVAMLAVQLGMKEEAEQLYRNCKRFDILAKFYQASGEWVKAVQVGESQDRIHLRTTYYNFARHSEGLGDLGTAVNAYEKSGTHRTEVPRLLYDDPGDLEAYVMKSKDRSLRKWWAQYLESTGEMDGALQFYEAAQDYMSIVRVCCYMSRIDQAKEVATESGDRAACYHLARQLETMDQVRDALEFYSKAQCLTNAIKLAKEHGYAHELMGLALQGSARDMLDAATYYEAQPDMQDKAILLYHKAGKVGRAMQLAFDLQQFTALQTMADDLDESTDPNVLDRCARFFLEHNQFEKAVDLLVTARKHHEALDVCVAHNVPISEEIAERMTPPKANKDNKAEHEYRTKLLERMADCCLKQGAYHLATKKYTQAGNKLKAMKALLKSRDTEKIIFFANVSRQREIFVMAANYLQQQEWRKNPEIMKHIISFYTKGKALEALSGFYDACAQVEIDSYQNYDKALGALNEALKCMSKAKSKNPSDQEEKVAFLRQRVVLLKKFVQIRRMYEDDPSEAVKQCQLLLDEPDLETAVRLGDVYGFVIEHYAGEENYKQAYSLMEEMRRKIPNLNMAFFVNLKVVEGVHRALGVPLGRGMGAEATTREDDDDEVDEELYNGEAIDSDSG